MTFLWKLEGYDEFALLWYWRGSGSIISVAFVALIGNTSVGQWRLVGGKTSNEGRLEYKFINDHTWRTICTSTEITLPDVCSQLGFSSMLSVYWNNKFGSGDEASYLIGRELDFMSQCSHKLSIRCSKSKNRWNPTQIYCNE